MKNQNSHGYEWKFVDKMAFILVCALEVLVRFVAVIVVCAIMFAVVNALSVPPNPGPTPPPVLSREPERSACGTSRQFTSVHDAAHYAVANGQTRFTIKHRDGIFTVDLPPEH